ncbi:MAG: alpha-2-macroglobulin, partial [Planctomycetes bacterium]|nr:alpha-2-macroglobulin [Planctomycetota bacterium]
MRRPLPRPLLPHLDRRLRLPLLGAALALALTGALAPRGEDPAATPPDRARAAKAQKDGNWKTAYLEYRKLLLAPDAAPDKVGDDLTQCMNAVSRLGTWENAEPTLEEAVKLHAANPRLLNAAARAYLQQLYHYGTIIAGAFTRGPHRGGTGRWVSAADRDRVRALQLYRDAADRWTDADPPALRGAFFAEFSDALFNRRGGGAAWRLQELTDLATLPDYLDNESAGGYDAGAGGAPVNPDGTPVFYAVPASWAAAKNDGERWRWCLERAAAVHPPLAPGIRWQFAQFLRQQFDVQTLAQYGWFFAAAGDDREGDAAAADAAAWSLSGLADGETIARLATGIKRFPLPDEFNFIQRFQEIADGAGAHAAQALEMLALIMEDRRQYPRAAEYWRAVSARFRETPSRKQRLEQIVGNWGRLEFVSSQAAGRGATVDYRFRNGTKIECDAVELDLPTLLDDIRTFIAAKPRELDWQKIDPQQIGYRLVQREETKYAKGEVARWSLDLTPRKKHFDRRITVTTPLAKPGAYLLTARMQDGNVSRTLLWIADTVIVKKPLDNATWLFVADAVSGLPVAGAQLRCFGYKQQWRGGNQRPDIETSEATYTTDADGQCVLPAEETQAQFTWLITATTPADAGGRLAWLGWTRVWGSPLYDQVYQATKVFGITDRPVYRPAQTVKFKVWIAHAKYDETEQSPFAGRPFGVTITNPKGESLLKTTLTADAYGGVTGELALARDAALGVYHVIIDNTGHAVAFRVEEYKKPEFEVLVESPTAPVMLGEKVTATIRAKYLFGAPVNEGKVKYKVLRSPHTAEWYPAGAWDWFYGPGYWWFACDAPWYPGWSGWGCRRPAPWWWWDGQPQAQPEVVADVETPLGADGVVTVEIDTAIAKAMHGDQDHRYSITAEVTDPSRRVIVGAGAVLVARKPFKVYAWVDRGHYREGETVQAQFRAQTLDAKPVAGKGELRLLRITYGGDGKPVESEVEKWALDPDAQGAAEQQIRAAQGGQYRLAYTVTDGGGHAIEGGYLFTVADGAFGDGAGFRFNALELVPDKREYAPGESARLQVNINRAGGAVLLFARPANSVYRKPTLLRLSGKSLTTELAVIQKDMPNLFVEAVTVAEGKVHTEVRELIVPPAPRVLDVQVTPSAAVYRPGAKAKVKVRLTDAHGEPFTGSTVVTLYDKALEYISGGSNVPDIREFFWKWRRGHRPQDENTLQRGSGELLRQKERSLAYLGVFGGRIDEGAEQQEADGEMYGQQKGGGAGRFGARSRGEEERGALGGAAAPGAAMEQ